MKLFQLGGIVFRFNWVFLLLLFILAFYGYLGETVVLFFLVFAHEMVHLLAARSRGLEIGAVELFPFGGVATIEDALELDPETESMVSLAGPLFNFFLAAAGLLVYANIPAWQENEFIQFFIRSNLTLGFFNLLPALPLDGGRILRARLCSVMGFQRATETAVRISRLLALFLLALGFYLLFNGHFHLTLLAAACFLYYAAGKERTASMYAFIRGLSRKKMILYKQGVMPLVVLVALKEAVFKDLLRRFAMKKYHRIVVVDRDGNILGEFMENEVVGAIVKSGIYARVEELLK